MFVDELLVTVVSGAGGNGCSAFRHEKYVPMGGPAGGDGGRGGDIVFVADAQLTTFGDMVADRVLRATAGAPGKGGNRHGADGEDRVVSVPPGTRVFDASTGEALVDLVTVGQRWVAAPGGRGGFGNSHFRTATDQAPTRTTPGEPSVSRRLRLELRLLADAGLVGLPNAGKSTLLSRLSRARPKIAAYPFTTLAPHLGLVELRGYRRFVLADLPGLVEGAHEGRGLGDRFLRHVERTRVLVHLVDLFPTDGSALDAYRTVRAELEAYGHDVAGRTEVLVGTKADLVPAAEAAAAGAALARAVGKPVLVVSAATGAGLDDLVRTVAAHLHPDEAGDDAGLASPPAAPAPAAAPAPSPAAAGPTPARVAPRPSAPARAPGAKRPGAATPKRTPAGPAKGRPAKARPTKAGPTKAGPAKAGPAKARSAKARSAKARSAKARSAATRGGTKRAPAERGAAKRGAAATPPKARVVRRGTGPAAARARTSARTPARRRRR